MTLFGKIVDVLRDVTPVEFALRGVADPVLTPNRVITRAVIQAIIDHTDSPRTVDELTRILKEEV